MPLNNIGPYTITRRVPDDLRSRRDNALDLLNKALNGFAQQLEHPATDQVLSQMIEDQMKVVQRKINSLNVLEMEDQTITIDPRKTPWFQPLSDLFDEAIAEYDAVVRDYNRHTSFQQTAS